MNNKQKLEYLQKFSTKMSLHISNEKPKKPSRLAAMAKHNKLNKTKERER